MMFHLTRIFPASFPTVICTAVYCAAASSDQTSSGQQIHDTIVIGGGVVGLAVGRELAVRGYSCLLLEKDHAICTGASSGNSGIGCTGYDAPAGSLEQRLLRRSILRHPNLYRSLGLSYNHVNKCGALVVAWTNSEAESLSHVIQENHQAGDLEACFVSQDELREMEPALSQDALAAVHVPREMLTEPWLIPIAYANNFLLNGGTIQVNAEVTQAELVDASNSSNLNTEKHWKLTLRNGKVCRARTVINCAGLYGDLVDKMCVGSSTFNIHPRKGQFVVYSSKNTKAKRDEEGSGLQYIIQPVPTERTKGVIVWESVYGNLVVGPTAEEQLSRESRSNTEEVIDMLMDTGARVLPELNKEESDWEVVGTYSGIRPATNYRDYQIIDKVKEKNWITVGGIRSTGLTCASGISEYVVNMFEGKEQPPTSNEICPPYLPSLPLQNANNAVPNPTAPDLQTLATDYFLRNDGKVEVFGRVWTVTHPLSAFGMKTMGSQQIPKRRKNENLREYKVRHKLWMDRKEARGK